MNNVIDSTCIQSYSQLLCNQAQENSENGQLGFDYSHPEPEPSTTFEPKYCEVCSKTFLRHTGTDLKLCHSCSPGDNPRMSQETVPLSSTLDVAISYLESDPDTRPKPEKPYLAGDLLRMICISANVAFNQANAKSRWPWLKAQVALPCSCKKLLLPNAVLVLQHLYDEHILERADWTPDDLVKWARSHEGSTPVLHKA